MTPAPFLRNAALGTTQILLWGGSYFLMAVIADPVVAATGWSRAWVIGALSIAILVSGLPAPFIGRLIRRHGGRPVLIAGSLILAIGLAIVAAATSLPVFLLGWAVIGIGMAASLYDPLFSTVGQTFGEGARSALTQITLISGFAISLCWPASHFLVQLVGWRATCLAYAAAAILIVIPLFAWAVPSHANTTKAAVPAAEQQRAADAAKTIDTAPKGLYRLAASFTAASMIMTAISVELLMLLQLGGVSADHAVALSALIGPAQVLARGLESVFGKRAHPYWSMLASAICTLTGLVLLAVVPSFAWLAIILYGAGNGIRTIVRGTLPLAMYGQYEYATVIGRLARPPLIGQAATPLAAGLLVQHLGNGALLPGLLAVAAVNLLLVFAVFPLIRPARKEAVAETPSP
jgi:predicted MFS family arabinose efflux permease